MRGRDATAEQKLAAIAALQCGVVARNQALAAGISSSGIERRLDKGSLIAVHPGVYRVGHVAPSIEADYRAAVLACGETAVLSGHAAAHLLGLVRGRSVPEPEVLTTARRRVAGVVTRQTRRLSNRDRMNWQGIPITTPARTLVDLAAVVHEGELSRAVHEASVRHGTTAKEIEGALSRRPNAEGAGRLRAVVRGDVAITLSKLERRFLKVMREAGLPLPITNRLAGGRFVDCRWPEHKLTVELDSYRYHSSRHAWEKDRKREREAYARGDQLRRYTWDDVTKGKRVILRELRPILRER
jgi:very-short-patch-repair endonuclease